ncbi:Ribosomal protein methylthiotransferase [Lachnospiraceae bacterium TWA4]|nr:Ribosomal protein methylthiotransferase [Lachnospiraceae bacterium TWA4]
MKILFVSLGCDKNLADTEEMLGILNQKGYSFTDDENEADVIIVNTCSFISDAKEESIQTILEMAEHKKQGEGNCKVLLATGCLVQRYKEEILEEIPELDGVLGVFSCDHIAELVENTLEKKGQKTVFVEDKREVPYTSNNRVVTTGGHYAFLKIAEGCDKHCTYCAIPAIRGSYHSVPMEQLVEQAKAMAKDGVKELIIVAQETTLYGTDIYGYKALPKLLEELAKIDGIYWIRLQYCYPEEITRELIETMAREPKICHYLDIPIQHSSNAVLKRMGRKTTRESIISQIQMIREILPDVALRTTFIAGFPGEMDENHKENLEFIDEMKFDRLGVFTYSMEEGTPAAKMEDQIDEEVKEDRMADIMELQQEIAFEKSEQMVGKKLYVMIEGKVADDHAYVSRTYMDAPNVDGYLFVQTDEELMTGDFVKVLVTGAVEYDLIGEPVYE